MNSPLLPPFFFLFGYLSGSLPFALWITKWVKGIDLREAGSGHTGATNAMRQAGWGPAILIFALDITKGYLPIRLALQVEMPSWVIALTAALVVIGHCWTIFGGFRGGMGLATALGAMLAVNWLGVVICVGVLVGMILIIRHAARATVIGAVVAPFVLWLLGQQGLTLWVSISMGVVIGYRFLSDWNREYQEVWLDREPSQPNGSR